MDTKSLLYGLIGFFIGGLLVSIAAHTFNNEELQRCSLDEPVHARTTVPIAKV